MTAWFDLDALPVTESSRIDTEGLEVSSTLIAALLNDALKKYEAKNIYLCGFSQGGALALYAGTRCPYTLGGIAVFGACSPGPLLDPLLYASALATPIVLVHGLQDRTVPARLSDVTEAELQRAGFPVVAKLLFHGGHELPEHVVRTAFQKLTLASF